MSELEIPVLFPVETDDEATFAWTAPARPGLTTPASVTVRWRDLPRTPLVTAFDDGALLDPAAFLDRVLDLADALSADHFLGNPMLATWSLRHDERRLVVAGVAPGLTDGTSEWTPPFDDPPEPGPARDLYLLGVALFRAVTGRWPHSRVDAVETAGVVGAEWPSGAGLAVRLCLHPDPQYAATTASHLLDVVRAVRRLPGADERMFPVVAQESVTGWRKAYGRPGGDNEDTVLWQRHDDGGIVGLVADGVTGSSDGTGQVAADVVAATAARAWEEGVVSPAEVLRRCDRALREEPGDPESRPAATAVAFSLDPAGRLELASAGDSPAFLCRPTTRGVAVTRLNAEHSRLAERLRAGEPPADADQGVITMACGAGAPLVPHVVTADLHPGDRLLLTSDGASKADEADGGQRCYAFMDTLGALVADDPYPALLASQLCRRADDLGGHDNATVLVVGVATPEDPKARTATVARKVRSVATGLA